MSHGHPGSDLVRPIDKADMSLVMDPNPLFLLTQSLAMAHREIADRLDKVNERQNQLERTYHTMEDKFDEVLTAIDSVLHRLDHTTRLLNNGHHPTAVEVKSQSIEKESEIAESAPPSSKRSLKKAATIKTTKTSHAITKKRKVKDISKAPEKAPKSTSPFTTIRQALQLSGTSREDALSNLTNRTLGAACATLDLRASGSKSTIIARLNNEEQHRINCGSMKIEQYLKGIPERFGENLARLEEKDARRTDKAKLRCKSKRTSEALTEVQDFIPPVGCVSSESEGGELEDGVEVVSDDGDDDGDGDDLAAPSRKRQKREEVEVEVEVEVEEDEEDGFEAMDCLPPATSESQVRHRSEPLVVDEPAVSECDKSSEDGVEAVVVDDLSATNELQIRWKPEMVPVNEVMESADGPSDDLELMAKDGETPVGEVEVGGGEVETGDGQIETTVSTQPVGAVTDETFFDNSNNIIFNVDDTSPPAPFPSPALSTHDQPPLNLITNQIPNLETDMTNIFDYDTGFWDFGVGDMDVNMDIGGGVGLENFDFGVAEAEVEAPAVDLI